MKNYINLIESLPSANSESNTRNNGKTFDTYEEMITELNKYVESGYQTIPADCPEELCLGYCILNPPHLKGTDIYLRFPMVVPFSIIETIHTNIEKFQDNLDKYKKYKYCYQASDIKYQRLGFVVYEEDNEEINIHRLNKMTFNSLPENLKKDIFDKIHNLKDFSTARKYYTHDN